ncbi:MAG: type II secretion system protein GspN [Deltaproteobacteria bacterium]
MKDRIKKFKHIKPLSYTFFFVIVFTAFLFATFPREIIKNRTIAEIERNTPFEADIESVSVSPLLSINYKGVKLYKSRDRYLELDSLTVSPSVLSFITGSPKFPFSAELLGGEVKGSFVFNKAKNGVKKVDATVKNVSIDSIPALLSNDPQGALSIGGTMQGELYAQFEPQAQGKFQFEINGLNLYNVKVKGFTLPGFNDLKSVFKGNFEGKTTEIEEFNVKGDDIDVQITGTAPLLWEIPSGGVINLGYRIQMKGAQMARYKGILEPYLATLQDGSLGGKILGTVKNPRFEKGSVKRF